jgi:hypothetical protein
LQQTYLFFFLNIWLHLGFHHRYLFTSLAHPNYPSTLFSRSQVLSVLTFLKFEERPPTPPSASAAATAAKEKSGSESSSSSSGPTVVQQKAGLRSLQTLFTFPGNAVALFRKPG